jgi:hypothetical protein
MGATTTIIGEVSYNPAVHPCATAAFVKVEPAR